MSDLFPISAPASGRLCCLDDQHPAFVHNRIFGNGPLLDVAGNQIVAPFSAVVDDISASGDYIRLRHPSASVLTLILGDGRCFQQHPALVRQVKRHQQVQKGDVLLNLNQSLLRASDPQQRRLAVLLESAPTLPDSFHWAESGAISLLDSIIFDDKQENS